MTSYSVKRDKVNNYACFLIPPKKELTTTFFERIKLFNEFARNYDEKKGKQPKLPITSIWQDTTYECSTIVWQTYKFTNTRRNDIFVDGVIVIPEMINRYGYVSSYAYMINSVVNKFSINRQQKLELLYITLLQTSQIQFVFIMRQILKQNMISSCINLYRFYNKLCTDYNLSLTGGPLPRCQGQPITHKTDNDIKK